MGQPKLNALSVFGPNVVREVPIDTIVKKLFKDTIFPKGYS